MIRLVCIPLLVALILLAGSLQSASAQTATSLTQAIHYIKLAGTLRAVNKSEESINLLNRALPMARKTSRYWTAVANENLGLAYSDINQPDNAVYYLELARAYYGKLKYVASGWAVNEVVRDIAGKNLYAGIQIGTTGVRVAIFKTKYESDFYEKDVRSNFYIPNGEPVADASRSFRVSQNALAVGMDSIRHYNIPNERIFIVFSSDIQDNFVRSAAGKQALYNQLMQTLPTDNLRIDTTLSVSREAELFTIGAIPRKVWPTTSSLNLGPNSTTGGYIEQATPKARRTFQEVTFPVGTNTLVSRIENQPSMTMNAYRKEAQRLVQAMADTFLTPRLVDAPPGLRQRRVIGVAGEAVEALATYLYPEKSATTAVPITADDVSRFRQLALTDYARLTRPDLSGITDAAVRGKAEKNVQTIQGKLNEKQLIAAALWLDAVVKAYTVSYGVRRFVFIRNADIGWVTGKFLETINYEYESTIAKGAFYTR